MVNFYSVIRIKCFFCYIVNVTINVSRSKYIFISEAVQDDLI